MNHVRIFMEDIKMEFEINKCVCLLMSKRKNEVKTGGKELKLRQVIEEVQSQKIFRNFRGW